MCPLAFKRIDISENQWGSARGPWKTHMPFGLVKFAFSLARISLPHKQPIHLPLGLLHSHEQEEKGFALLQIGWRVL